jgi:hypothetical protein
MSARGRYLAVDNSNNECRAVCTFLSGHSASHFARSASRPSRSFADQRSLSVSSHCMPHLWPARSRRHGQGIGRLSRRLLRQSGRLQRVRIGFRHAFERNRDSCEEARDREFRLDLQQLLDGLPRPVLLAELDEATATTRSATAKRRFCASARSAPLRSRQLAAPWHHIFIGQTVSRKRGLVQHARRHRARWRRSECGRTFFFGPRYDRLRHGSKRSWTGRAQPAIISRRTRPSVCS